LSLVHKESRNIGAEFKCLRVGWELLIKIRECVVRINIGKWSKKLHYKMFMFEYVSYFALCFHFSVANFINYLTLLHTTVAEKLQFLENSLCTLILLSNIR